MTLRKQFASLTCRGAKCFILSVVTPVILLYQVLLLSLPISTKIKKRHQHFHKNDRSERNTTVQAFQDSLLLLSKDVVPLTAITETLSSRGVRRFVMRRFPFSIVVREIGDDTFEVIAVAHHARSPFYWRTRLST